MAGERVLILVQNESLPSDRHVQNEGRALVEAGYAVTAICPTGEGRDLAPREVVDGVEIHRYRPRRAGERKLGYALEYMAALREMRRLANQLAWERPFDLVHACSPPDFLLLAALAQRRRGARLVFDHHDLTPELFRTRFGGGPVLWATLAAEQVAFRAADVVLSVNDSYRRIAIGRGGRDPADVFIVRTAPDLARFAPTAPDEPLRRGRAHLLAYVGVMGPQDGVEEALHALAALAGRRRDWRAILMGDGSVLPAMRALAGRLGLAEMVEFTGWVEHETVRRVLSTADVCLAPDPSNPLNDLSSMVKISEYMAIGRPFVSFDLAESRAAGGDAGAYAPSGDRRRFAELIAQLLDDPARRAAMGAAGRRRAAASLSWEHQRRSLLAAYARALALGPAAESPLRTARRLASRPRPRPAG